jgi:hypothetical protein
MIRKLLVVAATLTALTTLALAAGVGEASADSVIVQPIVPAAQPDLVVSNLNSSTFSVTNKPDYAYPTTAAAGAFHVHVDRWWRYCGFCSYVLPSLDFTIGSQAPGATYTFCWANCDGGWSLANAAHVTVDSLNEVPERDETNNSAWYGL